MIGSVLGCFSSPYYQQPYTSPYAPAPYYGGVPYAASKSRMASDTHTYVSGNSIDAALDERHQDRGECVRQRLENQRIECAVSVERRMPTTESDCQRFCLESALKCRAFQFDSLGMACDLFDEPIATQLFAATLAAHDSPADPFGGSDDVTSAYDADYRRKRQRRFVLHNGVQSAIKDYKSGSNAFAAPGVQANSPAQIPPSNDPLGLSSLL